MPKYPVTGKEGIAYFIYKITPLLSIDVDKETAWEVIKRYILKVSRIYARYILYLYLQ